MPESDSLVLGRVAKAEDLLIAVWTVWTVSAVDMAPRGLSLVQPAHAPARARLASRPCFAFSATTVDVGTCNDRRLNSFAPEGPSRCCATD